MSPKRPQDQSDLIRHSPEVLQIPTDGTGSMGVTDGSEGAHIVLLLLVLFAGLMSSAQENREVSPLRYMPTDIPCTQLSGGHRESRVVPMEKGKYNRVEKWRKIKR